MITAIALTMAPASSMAAEILDQESSLGPGGGSQSAWVWVTQSVAQPFVPCATGPLTKVTIGLGREVAADLLTSFTVGIYATAMNKPTGLPLAERTFTRTDVTNLPTGRTPTTVTVTFATPPAVVEGTTYAIVVSTDNGNNGDDFFHWFVGDYETFDYSLNGDTTRPGTTRWDSWPYPLTFSTYVDGTKQSLATPPAPTVLEVVPGDGSATVVFSPGLAACAGVTTYEYSLDGVTWVDANDTSTPLTIPGLVNGSATSVQIRARNAGGPGAASTPVTVTSSALAAKPTSLVGTAGDASASVAFTAGADGGTPITNYQYELDGSGTWVDLSPADATSPVTVPGLVNGTPVSIKLRPVNAAGSGASSDAVTVTPVARDSSGGSGGGESQSTSDSSAGSSANTGSATSQAPGPVPINEPIAVGDGLVIVNGVASRVGVQALGGRSWRVSGDEFTMEFVPEQFQDGLAASFSVRAGGWIDISGDGYQPGTLVATYLPGFLAASLGEARVSADGTFALRAQIPPSLTPGQYVLQVNGLASPTSVRSVNMGLNVLEARAASIKAKPASQRAFFKPGSVVLTPKGRAAITRLVSENLATATSAVVVPRVPVGASPQEYSLAQRRGAVVVRVLRASGLSVPVRATKVRPIKSSSGDTRVTAWIRQ